MENCHADGVHGTSASGLLTSLRAPSSLRDAKRVETVTVRKRNSEPHAAHAVTLTASGGSARGVTAPPPADCMGDLETRLALGDPLDPQ